MKPYPFILSTLALMAATAPAMAYTLPGMGDPWNAEGKTAAYGGPNLRPKQCPKEIDTSRKMTMTDVVVLSLCNNPSTKASYFNLLASAASYGGSYSAYLPTITATAGYEDNRVFNNNNNSFSSRLNDTGDTAGIDASMTLFDFGKREANIESAEQSLIAAGQTYDSALQGMIASALQGYYRLLTSQNGVAAAEESERFAKASYEAAQLRHQIGQVALADELQAKGSYSQAVLATQQARNLLMQDRASLAIMMGLSADAPIDMAEMDNSYLKLAPFGSKVKELIEEAKTRRNDLAANRSQLESTRASLDALKRSDLPSVSASAGQRFDDLEVFGNGTQRIQTLGVSVSIPIFTGFAQTYSERAATERLKAQEQQVAQSELNVQQDVWNAWNNYETAKQSWDTSLDLLDSATALRDVALGRYKEGLGTILDVLNAQSQYSAALQSQLQARYNLLTARTDLVRAVGIIDLNSMRPDTTRGGTLEPVSEIPSPATGDPETSKLAPENTSAIAAPAPAPVVNSAMQGAPLPWLDETLPPSP